MSTKTGSQKKLQNKIQRLVILAVLVALIIVLQGFGVMIPIGIGMAVSLFPIVLGAIMYGPVYGAVLGGTFGIVVAVQVLMGKQGLVSANMFAENPALTLSLCIFKGIAAGFVSGLVAKLLIKKNLTVASLLSAAICPIVNTGIFAFGLQFLYSDGIFDAETGPKGAFLTLILTLFALEFIFNLIVSPVIVRVIKALKDKKLLDFETGNV
ncbi:MAG: ECF transporter S component [Ruminococcaceae bacterium]|nr:ECF transporter S component [Oscillospiraceae bacterium]